MSFFDIGDIVYKILTFCNIQTFCNVVLSCKTNCTYADNQLLWCDYLNRDFRKNVDEISEIFKIFHYKQIYKNLFLQRRVLEIICKSKHTSKASRDRALKMGLKIIEGLKITIEN